MFLDGSLGGDTHAVIARIKDGNLFLKLTNYVVESVGTEYRIAQAEAVAIWLAAQAKPALESLAKAKDHMTIALKVQKEFKDLVGGQLEVAGPYLQHLKAIYEKHQQAHVNPDKE